MAFIEVKDPAWGDLACSRCGHALTLYALYVFNHLDPPRSLVEFLPEPEDGLRLNVICDGPDVEDGVAGDYMSHFALDDHDQGVQFEMACRRCDAEARNTSIFEVRFRDGKTTFHRDGDVVIADPQPAEAGSIEHSQ